MSEVGIYLTRDRWQGVIRGLQEAHNYGRNREPFFDLIAEIEGQLEDHEGDAE